MSDFDAFSYTPPPKKEPSKNWWEDDYTPKMSDTPTSQSVASEPVTVTPLPLVSPPPTQQPIAQPAPQPLHAPSTQPPAAGYAPTVDAPQQPTFAAQSATYPLARPKKPYRAGFLTYATILVSVLAMVAGAYQPIINIARNTPVVTAPVPTVTGNQLTSGSASLDSLVVYTKAAQGLLDGAEGKVDVSILSEYITKAKEVAAASDSTTEDFGRALTDLRNEIQNVRIALNIYEFRVAKEQVQQKLNAGEFSLGPTREDDVRRILDALGGTEIGIIYQSNPCQRSDAAACVDSVDPTLMYVSPLILDKSYYADYMLVQTIAHEYGHVKHFRDGYFRILEHPEISKEFKDDPEYIADCMAEAISGVVFTTYGYTCSDRQVELSVQIWTETLPT